MAIGDSITAGAFSRGIQENPLLSLSEWRGQSYAAGMDEGAITIPNVCATAVARCNKLAEYTLPVH